jgi:hypothetical protein
MNKLRLLTFILLAAFLIQSCKKETVTGNATTTAPFQANVNGLTWAPDTVSTNIVYNATAKTKTFTCTATKDQKQAIMTITLKNADSGNGFIADSYVVDSAATVVIKYNTQQKNAQGQYVFLPHGTVDVGSGTIVITSIDPSKNQVTGTFHFVSRTPNPDGSLTIDNIAGGVFNSIPYTFSSN